MEPFLWICLWAAFVSAFIARIFTRLRAMRSRSKWLIVFAASLVATISGAALAFVVTGSVVPEASVAAFVVGLLAASIAFGSKSPSPPNGDVTTTVVNGRSLLWPAVWALLVIAGGSRA